MQPYILPFSVALVVGTTIYAVNYGLFILWKSLPVSLAWIAIIAVGGSYFPLYPIMAGFLGMLLLSVIGACFMGDSVEGNHWKFWWAFTALFPAQILSMEVGLFISRYWVQNNSMEGMYMVMLAVSVVVPAFLVWCGKIFRGTLSSTFLPPRDSVRRS